MPRFDYVPCDDCLMMAVPVHTGRGLGGLFSSMAAHHFGVMSVFVGSALICLFTAAFWLTILHAVVKPQRKFQLFGRPASQQDSTSNDLSRRGH
jgi:hypothetical protein